MENTASEQSKATSKNGNICLRSKQPATFLSVPLPNVPNVRRRVNRILMQNGLAFTLAISIRADGGVAIRDVALL